MRKITSKSVEAFLNFESYSEGNTKVSPANNNNYFYLHGNIIAILNRETNKLKITNCGWKTNTTKERLNALPNVNIKQSKGVWYLNGKEWDGGLIEV